MFYHRYKKKSHIDDLPLIGKDSHYTFAYQIELDYPHHKKTY